MDYDREQRSDQASTSCGLIPNWELFHSGTYAVLHTEPAGVLVRCARFLPRNFDLLYCSITMPAKPQSGNHSKRKSTELRAVAQAELPTRYGRFTIYGF